MRVFILNPYHAGSHAAWADGYDASSRHEVHVISMEGRFWKWRMHGGPVTLSEQARILADEVGKPDVFLATDMVDLPTFLAFVRDWAGDVPSVLYMHENQLTYPISPRSTPDLTFGFMNWKSMLIADAVVYNSAFHRGEVEARLPGVLKNFPDYRHLDQVASVVDKTSVLPVGIDLARFADRGAKAMPPLVLWNQRWEHDKNPEEMIAALSSVIEKGIDIRIALCGENFRNEPDEFLEARKLWGDRLIHFGWAEPEGYVELVASADIVVSTAEHEFFGIAVIEALAAGAAGVLPRRLSYPGVLFPETADEHLYDTFEEMVEMIIGYAKEPHAPSSEEQAHYQQFDWSTVAPRYDRLLEEVGS